MDESLYRCSVSESQRKKRTKRKKAECDLEPGCAGLHRAWSLDVQETTTAESEREFGLWSSAVLTQSVRCSFSSTSWTSSHRGLYVWIILSVLGRRRSWRRSVLLQEPLVHWGGRERRERRERHRHPHPQEVMKPTTLVTGANGSTSNVNSFT